MSQFNIYPIPHFPGHMTVIRAFGFDVYTGEIKSPLREKCLWREGRNTAECPYGYDETGTTYYDPRLNQVRVRKIDGAHLIVDKRCTCGFYGYFSKEHADQHLPPSGVLGIMKAYGRCTVGEFGCRAQYMEPVCWILPVKEELPLDPAPQRPEMPSLGKYAFLVAATVAISSISVIMSVLYPDQGWWMWVFWSGISGTWMTTFWRIWVFRKWKKAHNQFLLDKGAWHDREITRIAHSNFRSAYYYDTDSAKEMTRLIKRSYPNIPIYYSVEEAITAFPLSGPPET